jgi:ADP-heptose:LPS heptosyltransferase
VQLISLQKGYGTEQLTASNLHNSIVDFSDSIDAEGTFLDTAAIMKNLDLVITVDTALAHLAGALGVKVWLALSKVPDWRWLQDRSDTPWYPTMRLFRQPRAGDWNSVFTEMAKELNLS